MNIFETITKRSSRTFYTTTRFFPKQTRDDVYKLYAYVRTVDDYIDAVPPKKTEYLLFKRQTQHILSGKADQEYDELVSAFAQIYRKYKFKKTWIDAFFRSQEMDLVYSSYQTFEELETFIYGTAEVIGFFMASIMKLPEKTHTSARLLGKSMQLLNIIRDIQDPFLESEKMHQSMFS